MRHIETELLFLFCHTADIILSKYTEDCGGLSDSLTLHSSLGRAQASSSSFLFHFPLEQAAVV